MLLLPLMAAFEHKAHACLVRLDDEAQALSDTPLNIGQIAIGCSLGCLDYRFDDQKWRAESPAAEAKARHPVQIKGFVTATVLALKLAANGPKCRCGHGQYLAQTAPPKFMLGRPALRPLSAPITMHPPPRTPALTHSGWHGMRTAAALLCCAVVLACGVPPAQPPSLYERLGGFGGVAQFVHKTLARAATDPRTARSFDGIKLQAVEQSLAEQICMLSGGGCRYQGATMADSHKDARIRDSEFDPMVGMLRDEMNRAGVTTLAASN